MYIIGVFKRCVKETDCLYPFIHPTEAVRPTNAMTFTSRHGVICPELGHPSPAHYSESAISLDRERF